MYYSVNVSCRRGFSSFFFTLFSGTGLWFFEKNRKKYFNFAQISKIWVPISGSRFSTTKNEKIREFFHFRIINFWEKKTHSLVILVLFWVFFNFFGISEKFRNFLPESGIFQILARFWDFPDFSNFFRKNIFFLFFFSKIIFSGKIILKIFSHFFFPKNLILKKIFDDLNKNFL